MTSTAQNKTNKSQYDDQLTLLAYLETAEQFKGLRQDTPFAQTAQFLRAVFIPGTPDHQLSLSSSSRWQASLYAKELPGWNQMTLLTQIARSELLQRGYRDEFDLRSPQEHKLIGSSPRDPTHLQQPHVPVGIQAGALTLEEAMKARELQRFTKALGCFYGETRYVDVTYEGLGADAQTLRDPRRINDLLEIIPTAYAANFPFRRPEKDHA